LRFSSGVVVVGVFCQILEIRAINIDDPNVKITVYKS